jgi:hypothetical protein
MKCNATGMFLLILLHGLTVSLSLSSIDFTVSNRNTTVNDGLERTSSGLHLRTKRPKMLITVEDLRAENRS